MLNVFGITKLRVHERKNKSDAEHTNNTGGVAARERGGVEHKTLYEEGHTDNKRTRDKREYVHGTASADAHTNTNTEVGNEEFIERTCKRHFN